MFKIDKKTNTPVELETVKLINLKDFNIKAAIEEDPEILGEDLLIIGRDSISESYEYLDFLAIDRNAVLSLIILMSEDTGISCLGHVIGNLTYCSCLKLKDIIRIFAGYINLDSHDAFTRMEDFLSLEDIKLQKELKLILVSDNFSRDLISSVLWLREFKINIICVKVQVFMDEGKDIYLTSSVIIPRILTDSSM